MVVGVFQLLPPYAVLNLSVPDPENVATTDWIERMSITFFNEPPLFNVTCPEVDEATFVYSKVTSLPFFVF